MVAMHRRSAACWAWCVAMAAGGVCPPAMGAVLQVPAQFTTIQGAINASANGDEIVVAPGTYEELLDLGGKSLTLRSTGGAAVTQIVGAGQGPIVLVQGSANTTLEGFTISGGSLTSGAGAGVRSVGSQVTIRNCVLQSNAALDGEGAALHAVGGSVTIEGSQFIGNVSNSLVLGAGLGGAVSVRDTTLLVTSSTFTNNASVEIGGGAIGASGSSVVTITSSTFTSNEAAATESGATTFGGGGALALRDSAAATITAGVFTDNRCTRGGGSAIKVIGNGNSASLTVAGGEFRDNIVNGGSGAIDYSASGTVLISGAVFEGNRSPVSSGGALSFSTPASSTPPAPWAATVEHCTFRGNSAGVAGALQTSTRTVVRDSLFENNVATGATSGSFVITGGGGAVRNSTTPQGTRYERCTFRNNRVLQAAGDGGGAMRSFRGFTQIVDCIFEGNSTHNTLRGGAVLFEGRTSSTLPVFQVTGSTFRENSVYDATAQTGGQGGAIGTTLRQDLTITGCTFEDNQAQLGGHVFVEGALNLTLTDSTFTGGGALPNALGQGGDGGAISATTTQNITLREVFIDGVSAKNQGGILASTPAALTLEDITLRNVAAVPLANGQGGDVGGAQLSGAPATIRNVLVENATAKLAAGMRVGGSSATIEASTFRNCVATPVGTGQFGDVGGLWVDSANATLRGLTFDNCAGKIAGGLQATGGGLEGQFLLEDSVFLGNDAIPTGSGSFGDGGGARIARSGLTTIRACRFDGNTARRGGGLWIDASNATILNSLFVRNTSTQGDGGGLMADGGGSHQVIQCTVANNVGGGVLFATAQNDWLRNSIVHGNTGGPPQIEINTSGGFPTVLASYCLVDGGYVGPGNIATNPLFVDALAGDFRLGAGSPAIDAGENAALPAGTTTDLAGNDRRVDDPTAPDVGAGLAPYVDIGAFERAPGLLCDALDFNNDGIEQDPTDIEAFLSVYSGGPCVPALATCNDIDFNNDGIEQDPTDIESFLSVYSGGPCL